MKAASPGQFLDDLFDIEPTYVIAAIRHQAARYRRPPMDLDDLLVRLGRAGSIKIISARPVVCAVQWPARGVPHSLIPRIKRQAIGHGRLCFGYD